ncbi:MAG TPA: hypothetical protein VNT23_03590, partial [Gaiellaceae bacterium]|nr:hypothetical protein [Gaiellaceae bacterium]
MKLKTIAATALAAAVVPVAALAQAPAPTGADKANGARACKALKASMGDTFAATYGTNADKSNAMGKCVSAWAKQSAAARKAAHTACKAEQRDPNFAASHDGKTFAQVYGNRKGSAAFARCVSAKQQATTASARKATVNAASLCKAERKADAAAFTAKYGTKANAFGKCVSQTAKTLQQQG